MQLTKHSVWKHTTRILRLLWEDITTQQKAFCYELTDCIESHSTEYRTHSEQARHGGFQTLDVEHRTDSRCPLDQPPGATTENDEDGDRRRRR